VLASLVLALSPVSGFTLGIVLNAATSGTQPYNTNGTPSSRRALANTEKKRRSLTPLLTVFLLTIFETALGSLSATYIGPPSSLECGLSDRWLSLFRSKSAVRIKAIQDAFECCGLRSPVDRAWPFPAKGVGADACRVRFDRDQSCLGPWREEEQEMAGVLLLVVVLNFLWQVCFEKDMLSVAMRCLTMSVAECGSVDAVSSTTVVDERLVPFP
jgi:hypothetical protein